MNGSDEPRGDRRDDRDIVRGRDGAPLRDRYGRPVYRRRSGAPDPVGDPAPRRRPSSGEPPRRRPDRDDLPRRRPLPSLEDRDAVREWERRHEGSRTQERINERIRARRAQNRGAAGAAGAAGGRHATANETRTYRRTGDAERFRGQDDPRFPPRGYDPDRDFGGHGNGHRPDRALPDYRDAADDPGRGSLRRKASRFLPGGARDRSHRRPRSLRRKLKLILLVLLLVLGGGAVWVDLNLNRVDAFAGDYDRPGRSLSTNWLLVGSDSRAGMTEDDAESLATGGGEDLGQRTDTIMIAHFPPVGGGRLVSIPRDSYVDIPGYGMNKINAAFSFGGAPLLVETVEQATGIRIDHYAEIGFGGFANIVDAMGGIEMCPAEPINDPLAGLDIQAGCQEFDGATALGYVRTRATAGGDFDRVGRQREFMGALMGRATSPRVLLNPFYLFRLGVAGTKSLTVGGGDHVWHLGVLLVRMAFGTESETVPDAGTMDTGHAGNVVLWDDEAARQMFEELR